MSSAAALMLLAVSGFMALAVGAAIFLYVKYKDAHPNAPNPSGSTPAGSTPAGSTPAGSTPAGSTPTGHGTEPGPATNTTGLRSIGQHALTWYTFQDNTPCNSTDSASGRRLRPFVSIAMPFTQLKKFGGPFDYGDWLFVKSLEGRTMPNDKKHTGWVQIDDFCGDNNNDGYCYKRKNGKKWPSLDMYIGDWDASRQTCNGGPAGSGLDWTEVWAGKPPAGKDVTDYGGAERGPGRRGDCSKSRRC